MTCFMNHPPPMFPEFVFMGPLLTLQGASPACSVLTPVFLYYFFHLPLPTHPFCTMGTNKLKHKLIVSIRAVLFTLYRLPLPNFKTCTSLHLRHMYFITLEAHALLD